MAWAERVLPPKIQENADTSEVAGFQPETLGVLAGGAVKGGMAYGATDPIGLRAEHNKVHIHDLHATILHILGIDHEQLTAKHHGNDERLTNVSGNVVKEILS